MNFKTGLGTFLVSFLYSQSLCAQTILFPSDSLVSAELVKYQKEEMVWYLHKDSQKSAIADIETTINPDYENTRMLVVQQVKMNGSPKVWCDTTVVDRITLSPIYHSSFNSQREMVLNFAGREITGYYKTLADNQIMNIEDTVRARFHDSNFYPHLIRFLPLKAGYQARIPIYDFNPKKHGLLFATITRVTDGGAAIDSQEAIPCFVVEVIDEIAPHARSTYYISKKDRRLIKSDISVGEKRMSIESR
ncbi:hypothetical protein LZG74_19870 [Dyadobacter sp. CY327]|uniref:DUF3108 domain-containing protein n=1 Tax=Dyadobacter sp. CY327 TaxID=2907301 RepID=UPI001F1DD551|nr:hypothetical protein [Dyadobacter sp. CY327]MCE7072584.1 hypothetical protein [Dyadobacter sp. CY327]